MGTTVSCKKDRQVTGFIPMYTCIRFRCLLCRYLSHHDHCVLSVMHNSLPPPSSHLLHTCTHTPSPTGSNCDSALALSETVGSRIIQPLLSTAWAACCTVSRTFEFLASSTTHCLRDVRREDPASRFSFSGGTCSEMAA